MTAEDKLKVAVHEYADRYCQSQFDQVTNAEMAQYMAPDWAKLLEAVDEFNDYRYRSLAVLRAKAAVCDALLAENVTGKGRAFLGAVAALRKLQGGEHGR